MFSTVLLPVDGSELSSKVLVPLLKLLTDDSPSSVVLFHAHAKGGAPQETQRELLRLAQLCGASGLPGTAKFGEGEPAAAILRAAREAKAELIAMASHGVSGIRRLVRGSVAERVLRQSPVPLLLCNPACLERDSQAPTFQKILVPYDGSELAASVLPGAAALAKAYDATVLVLRVENFSTGGSHFQLGDDEILLEELKPIAAQLEELGAREVETRVRYGHPVGEILAAIEEESIDLLAMASHGHGGLKNWWFGSTAEGVLRACPCPMYVTRALIPKVES